MFLGSKYSGYQCENATCYVPSCDNPIGLFDRWGVELAGDTDGFSVAIKPCRGYSQSLNEDIASLGLSNGDSPLYFEAGSDYQVNFNLEKNYAFSVTPDIYDEMNWTSGDGSDPGDEYQETYFNGTFQALLDLRDFQMEDGTKRVIMASSEATNTTPVLFCLSDFTTTEYYGLTFTARQASSLMGTYGTTQTRRIFYHSDGILQRISVSQFRWSEFPASGDGYVSWANTTTTTVSRTTSTAGSPVYKLHCVCKTRPDQAIAQDYTTGKLARCYFDGSRVEWPAGHADIREVLPGSIGVNRNVYLHSYEFDGTRSACLITTSTSMVDPTFNEYYDSQEAGVTATIQGGLNSDKYPLDLLLTCSGLYYGSPYAIRKLGTDGWVIDTNKSSITTLSLRAFELCGNSRWVHANFFPLDVTDITLAADRAKEVIDNQYWDIEQDLSDAGDGNQIPDGDYGYARNGNEDSTTPPDLDQWMISSDGTIKKPMMAHVRDANITYDDNGTVRDVWLENPWFDSERYTLETEGVLQYGTTNPQAQGSATLSYCAMAISFADQGVPPAVDY